MQIVVQAGGRGSRLRHYTWNTPKCLVSVYGKPLLYYLFDRFPQHEFIIIGDYLYDVLETYLKTVPPKINYRLIKASKSGTASGIKQALKYITGPFWLSWGDLIIDNLPDITSHKVTVATTNSFSCRWSVQNGVLKEIESWETGVPGLFYFPDPSVLKDIPEEGEFVKWLSQSGIDYCNQPASNMQEYGEFSKVEGANEQNFCRFFNNVSLDNTTVTKKAIVKEYEHLIKKEQVWYDEVSQLGFKKIPTVISKEPYVLERIYGCHPDVGLFNPLERRAILYDYMESLTNLHSLGQKPADLNDVFEVYVKKTKDRVNSVKNLIPNFNKKSIVVNGKKVKNIFHEDVGVWSSILESLVPKTFTPIHGDPHFSNAIVDNYLKVYFIDPRGYFYRDGIWGDPAYDIAKVYYSAVGNFDSLNKKRFKLHIDSETVEVMMDDSKYVHHVDAVFKDFCKDLTKIKLLHGLIWLAFSGYTKDSIDSVIASFYLGLYWLKEGME